MSVLLIPAHVRRTGLRKEISSGVTEGSDKYQTGDVMGEYTIRTQDGTGCGARPGMRWPGDGFDGDVDALLFGTSEHMANVSRRSRYWYRRRHSSAAVYRVETWRRPSLLWRVAHWMGVR